MVCLQSSYRAATTPAMAIAAAAKLPIFCAPGAAAPVDFELDPEPVGVAPVVAVAV